MAYMVKNVINYVPRAVRHVTEDAVLVETVTLDSGEPTVQNTATPHVEMVNVAGLVVSVAAAHSEFGATTVKTSALRTVPRVINYLVYANYAKLVHSAKTVPTNVPQIAWNLAVIK